MVQSSAWDCVGIVLLSSSVVSCEWGCFNDVPPSATASTIHFWYPCYFHTYSMVLFISEMCITTKDKKKCNKVFFSINVQGSRFKFSVSIRLNSEYFIRKNISDALCAPLVFYQNTFWIKWEAQYGTGELLNSLRVDNLQQKNNMAAGVHSSTWAKCLNHISAAGYSSPAVREETYCKGTKQLFSTLNLNKLTLSISSNPIVHVWNPINLFNLKA